MAIGKDSHNLKTWAKLMLTSAHNIPKCVPVWKIKQTKKKVYLVATTRLLKTVGGKPVLCQLIGVKCHQ